VHNEILEVEFKGRRKEYAANPQLFPFECGDPAIVATDRGHDLGKVSHIGLRAGLEGEAEVALTMVRLADKHDLEKLLQNREREQEAKRIAKKKIREHALEMKLVDVESQWDGRKMTFYFTADGRVDFRELVKDLASSFRTRIDLRQIGARDETRKTNGYGVCGRPLCCATFLTEFKPITTQMPRDQFLPLNPTKLSGVCGRLKCCLRYELDVYREFQRNCPKVGHPVQDTLKGEGVIEKLDVVREAIYIKYSSGAFDQVSQSEFMEISNWKPQMPKNECICTCGKGGKPIVSIPMIDLEEVDERTLATSGDRVTIDDSGISYEREEGGVSVNVQTDVSAGNAPAKKKKRRSRHKKSSSTGSPVAQPVSQPVAQTMEPPVVRPAREPAITPPAPESPKPVESSVESIDQAKKKRRRGGRRAHRPGKE
jgi:cell fate regulator YaaT (PSP1 superfamily)